MTAVVLGLVALGVWAGRATLRPPQVADSAPVPETYRVERGTVEVTQRFAVSVTWPRHDLAFGGASGTVTSVSVHAGDAVAAGATLFSLDARPVVAMQGRVPMFRSMAEGDVGPDVRQLQSFLTARGFSTAAVDGTFDSTTRLAVEAWQRTLHLDDSGEILRSDIVFIPRLPTRVDLSDDLQVGTSIAAVSPVLSTLGAAPTFEVELDAEQADLVPLQGRVRVQGPGGRTWHGRILRAADAASGGLVLTLIGRHHRPLCGESCSQVPAAGTTQYPVDLLSVPRTVGPMVPAAALATDAAGRPFVVTSDHRRHLVRILAADDGWSVVSGIAEGDQLLLFGNPP